MSHFYLNFSLKRLSSVAQLVERTAVNRKVIGSIPIWRVNKLDDGNSDSKSRRINYEKIKK